MQHCLQSKKARHPKCVYENVICGQVVILSLNISTELIFELKISKQERESQLNERKYPLKDIANQGCPLRAWLQKRRHHAPN